MFAGVALLVGGFLIFNTFAVTVAQRSKEFALLRTLGASRAPGAALGARGDARDRRASRRSSASPAAWCSRRRLRALLAPSGSSSAPRACQLEPRTIIAGFAVGIIATVVSGFVPARRATRVQPVEAMRDAVLPTGTAPAPAPHRRRRRSSRSSASSCCVYGLFGDLPSASAVASVLGFGAVVMMFGLALIAPVLVRPLSGVIGRPLERWQGLTGQLARENARRQPQRTAVTASALMIGLALVVFVTIFAAGLRATIDQGIDDQVRAAGIITHEDGFSPLPDGVVADARERRRRRRRVADPVRDRQAQERRQERPGHRRRSGDRRARRSSSSGTRARSSTLGRLGDRDVVVSETSPRATTSRSATASR